MTLSDDRGQSRLSGARFGAAFVLASLCFACGSKQTPPPEEPPLLEQPSEEEQAPSSEEVKKAIELIKAEKFPEAAEVLEAETAKSPEDPQAAFFYGVALEGIQQPQDAVGWYQKAADLQPKLLEAHQNLSALYLALEDPKAALEAANKGLEVAPKDPGLLINRAYAVDLAGPEDGPNPEALEAYEVALKVAPDNLNLQFYYAGALARADEKDKAVAQLDKLPMDGKTIPVVEIVTIYGEVGAFESCATKLTSQIEKEKTVELLVHRSACFAEAKKKKEAEADLRDAVKSFPESDVAHYYLGKFLHESGKKAEAKKHLDKANELKKAKAGG